MGSNSEKLLYTNSIKNNHTFVIQILMKKILFAFICSISLSLFADDLSPSNYTQQVVSDVDSIISVCDSLWDTYWYSMNTIDQVLNYSTGLTPIDRQNLTSAKAYLGQTYTTNLAITNYLYGIKSSAQNLIYADSYVQSSTDLTIVTNIYTILNDTYLNQGTIMGFLSGLNTYCRQIRGDIGSVSNLVSLIQQELYTTNQSFTIGDYISNINLLVQSISSNVTDMLSQSQNLNTWFERFESDYLQSYFLPFIINMGNIFTNFFWRVNNEGARPSQSRYFQANKPNPSAIPSFSFLNTGINTLLPYRFESIAYWLVNDYARAIASLNNYAYTNMVSLGSIAYNTSKTNDFSTIVSAIDRGSESITNTINARFSIFDVSSPLQSYYNLNNNPTNAYYNFLTNYYLNVSLGNASGSASESHTNWFSRIEMLLGALVFKDASDGSFSPGNTDMDSVANAYDAFTQSLETAVEIPSSFQSKIEDAEQSILDYMREWHSIISSATLGSHFTLCDVQLTDDDGSSSRRDGSTPSFDGRMNLSIPIEGNFKNFLDVSRALSTVCFITLFLIMSLKLIIFLLRACASITRVCYALFMAIAGH